MKEGSNTGFANNGKISGRQTLRLYVFDLMGIATLLLPPYLAKLCGVEGIYAILLGTGAGIIYLIYLSWIMKKMGTDMTTYLKEHTPVWIEKGTLLLVMLHSILTAGFCAYVFANLMQYSLVKDTSYGVILFLIIAVSLYAVCGGIESRARVYEVAFWFILVPYISMMLTTVRNIKGAYLENVLQISGENLGRGVYLVFLLISPLFFSLFLIAEKEKEYGKSIRKSMFSAVLISAGILLVSYVFLLGNFGEKSLASLRYPVVTLMSTIQFEGNFLKRMDALMLAVWFFTLYALLNLHMHYGVKMLEDIVGGNDKKRKWWQLAFPGFISFFVAYGMYANRAYLDVFLSYYSYAAVPFMLVVPTVLLLFRRKRK